VPILTPSLMGSLKMWKTLALHQCVAMRLPDKRNEISDLINLEYHRQICRF